MSLSLDHTIIAVTDLDAAIRDYRSLGFTVTPGGIHANRATHNALITFANGIYLELLAATGEAPIAGRIDFSVLLQQGEGLVGFALRADDLEAETARLRVAGFAVGEIIPGERRRQDGTLVQWKLALASSPSRSRHFIQKSIRLPPPQPAQQCQKFCSRLTPKLRCWSS